MQLYESKIEEALKYLKHSDILNPTGDRLISYVIYDVKDCFAFYRIVNSILVPKAKFHGFKDIKTLSIGEEIQDYINSCDDDCKEARESCDCEEDLYEDLRSDLTNRDGMTILSQKILDAQKELIERNNHPLLVIKDLEMLHPYDKMNRIEQEIYTHLQIPILILYPGKPQGNARSFLGVYKSDNSYRSKSF